MKKQELAQRLYLIINAKSNALNVSDAEIARRLDINETTLTRLRRGYVRRNEEENRTGYLSDRKLKNVAEKLGFKLKIETNYTIYI